MQEVSVLVVCRHNQARSIVIGALLRELFPGRRVLTSGVDANTGARIPDSTSALCENWGLVEFDRTSSALEQFEDLDQDCKVLAADDAIRDSLIELLPQLKAQSLYDYCESKELRPIDPKYLDYDEFCLEIAKAIIPSLRWADEVLSLRRSPITSTLFQDEAHILSEIGLRQLAMHQNSLLIDTNLAFPNWQLWEKLGYEIIEFNPRHLANMDISSTFQRVKGTATLVSKYEVDFPERMFLSKSWRNFLYKVSEVRKVHLVSTLVQRQGVSHKGILGLSHSSTTHVLN